MEPREFLKISDYCLSQSSAEKLVDEKLLLVNIEIPPHKKPNEVIIFHENKKNENRIKYLELIVNTRKQGVVNPVQTFIDNNDQIFGGTFGMATTIKSATIKFTYAGNSEEVKSAGRIYPIEHDLANDIIFYRKESCIKSVNHDFEMTCRNYRGYILSCISIIEAYINRHILFGKNNQLKSEKFERLSNSSKITFEEKIELFLEVFCKSNIKDINQGCEWSDFKLLKGFRNKIVHASTPFLGFEIKDIARNLNLSKKGIGGILKRFQELQGRQSLGFIELIRNAPNIVYNEKLL